MLIFPSSSYSFVKGPIFELLQLLIHSPFKRSHIFYILPIYSAACFFFSGSSETEASHLFCCKPLRLSFLMWLLQVLVGACGISSCGMCHLAPLPGIEPELPAWGAWSLSHWATRRVPSRLLTRPCPHPAVPFWAPGSCLTRSRPLTSPQGYLGAR